jgi:hypothetical protein
LVTALIIFAPSLMMPPLLEVLADHVSRRVLRKTNGRVDLVGELDELRCLVGLLAEQHTAMVGEDARWDSRAVRRNPCTSDAPYSGLNSSKSLSSDQPARSRRAGSNGTFGSPTECEQVLRIEPRRVPDRAGLRRACVGSGGERSDGRAESVELVDREVVGEATDPGMHLAPPSDSSSLSSPVAILTNGGPPRNTFDRFSIITM